MDESELSARSTAHDVRHLIHLALMALERHDVAGFEATRKALASATAILEPHAKSLLPHPIAKDVLYVLDLWCGTGTGGPFALEVRDSPPVALDPWVLRRAVLNLLLNARAASRDVIRIDVGREREDAVIRVRNPGPAISREDLERIRASTPLERENGHGVGLQGTIAALHAAGGRLELESSDATGTTATVRLPAFRGAAPRACAEGQRWSA